MPYFKVIIFFSQPTSLENDLTWTLQGSADTPEKRIL